jgi:hypothetical protein
VFSALRGRRFPVPYLSKIDPLVKQPCQGQEKQKNLLEKNEEVHSQPNPRWNAILVQEKQDDGKPMKNING